MPIVALLCITGSIYLFKSDFNNYVYQDARHVSAPLKTPAKSLNEQLNTAIGLTDHHIMSVTLPSNPNQATSFRQHSKGHSLDLLYVNPYTAELNGTYKQKESFMYTVRKLHGELLIGMPGTLVVELVASWFIVLILTGIYIWWPARGFSIRGFFMVRTNSTKRVFWRDMHAVLAFWMSLFLLVILAGGMPWTEFFGDNLKWVQNQTNTGYPQHWRNAKGLKSDTSSALEQPISLDQVAAIGNAHNLTGTITIKLPNDDSGVYSISNRSLWLDDQEVIHIDQYSGDVIKALQWHQVGILMNLRQIFMRFHQGEYGRINLIAVLAVALTFFVATVASLISYLRRKPKDHWGLPKPPANFQIGIPVLAIIGLMAIVFPAFGASVIVILLLSGLNSFVKRTSAV